MPTLEEKPTPVNTTEVTTAKAVVRLTIELSPVRAAELAELLACHVSFLDFPWAEAIYNALRPAGCYHEIIFTDDDHGINVLLRRKQD